MKHSSVVCLVVLVFVSVQAVSHAAERVKANNADNLNLTSSWVGGTVPAWNDSGWWNGTVTGPNDVLLGADRSLLGLRVTDPGGAVTIGGANTLTTSFEGFNLAGATQNLTLTNLNLTLLAYAGQIWDVASGRVLTLNPEGFTRQYGASVSVRGAGTVSSTALSNDATGIIGPWARHGTGTSTRYATVSGGNVVGYTGGTSVTAAGVTDTTGTANYDVTATGTLGAGASFNTLRYTAGSGTLSGAYTANGILNSGTDQVTLSGAATIGADKELVLTSPDTTRRITLSGQVSDNPGGASGITLTGGGRADLTASNTYSGVTVVSAGQLYISNSSALGATNGHTVIYSSSSSVTGGQLMVRGNITIREPITIVGRGDSAPYQQAIRVDGGGGTNTLEGPISLEGGGVRITAGGNNTVLNINAPITRNFSVGSDIKLGGNGAGGTVNVNAPIDNKGGTISLHSGPGTIRFNVSGNNIGDMNVQWGHLLQLGVSDALPTTRSLRVGDGSTSGGSSPGTFDLNGFNQTVNAFNGDGTAATYPPSTRVVTNSAETLSRFTVGNGNSGGSFNGVIGGNIALTKTGTGTQTLRGPNFYTGGTTVNNGTLVLSNAVSHGSLTVNGGTFRFPPALTVNGALSGTGGTIDTLADACVLTVNQTEDGTFAGVLSNAGSLVKTGAATLTLSGANTFSGGTTVSEGTLVFSRTAAKPASGTVTVADGAVLGLGVGGTGSFEASDIDALWGGTMAGVSLGAAASVALDTTAGDFTYETGLDGARALVKLGQNTLRLTGANTYEGNTVVRQGVLSIAATGVLPGWDTAGRYEVWPGAALAVQNDVVDEDVATILGTGNFSDGGCIGFDTFEGNRTYAEVIGNTANGALGLYKTGTNTLTLSGSSTYDGNTVVAGGILVVKNNQALGSTNGHTTIYRTGGTSASSWTDATGQVQLDGSGGSLVIDENFYMNGTEQHSYGGVIRNVSGNNVINGWIRLFSSGRVTVAGGNLVLNGPIELTSVSGAPSLVLNPSSGILTISNRIDIGTGAMSFHSGSVNFLCATGHVWNQASVQYGNTLRLGVENALPVDRPLMLGNSTPGNGRLDVYGYNQTVARLLESGTAGSLPNNIITNTRPQIVSTFTVSHAAGISDSFGGRINGAVSLVKAGAADSVLTLRGTNALTGTVSVQGGTLALDAAGTLGAGCVEVSVEEGTLSLGNSASISDDATLILAGGGGAKVHLEAGVNESVRNLFLSGKQRRVGTYGSSASSAVNKDDTYFSGTGVLTVLRDNSGTVIFMK